MGTGHLNDLLLPQKINEWLEHSRAGKWHIADLYLVSLYLNIIYCVATIIFFPVIFPLAGLLHYLANEKAFNHTSFPLIAATKRKPSTIKNYLYALERFIDYIRLYKKPEWSKVAPFEEVLYSIGLMRKALQ